MITSIRTSDLDMEPSSVFPAMTEADTKECASFLMTLKHRAITPEPFDKEDTTQQQQQQHYLYKSPTSPIFAPIFLNDSDDSVSSKAPSLQEEYDHQHQNEWIESLVEDASTTTTLLSEEDRVLVPDALFVAMAQMKRCELIEDDRVGCYKNRDLGFVGMCCKHCGGQPGFGKYFPATLRSLAQTTTSQTILKHVAQRCAGCPQKIRTAILQLQQKQASPKLNSSSTAGRPRYGSRKVFFQRIWNRLHDDEVIVEEQEQALSPPPLSLSEEQPYREVSEGKTTSRKRSRSKTNKRSTKPRSKYSNLVEYDEH